MAKPSEQILWEIKELKSWLYGADGKEGDIEEIKASLKEQNRRISRNSRIIYIVIGALSASGISFGAINLLG